MRKQKEDWTKEIQELKDFFNSVELPKTPLKLHRWSTIINIRTYIRTNLLVSENNNGKRTFLPYIDRMRELKKYILENGKKNS